MVLILSKRKWPLVLSATIVALAIAATIAVIVLNQKLTRYVESDASRLQLENETAKGLHFPAGRYAPIRRTGFLTAVSDGFHAENGRKAMTSIDARGLTAKFNPWGVLLRRWQFSDLHIQGGSVGIQTYEPKPEPNPAKPWFFIFLPDRVYLSHVRSDTADVTWHFRNRKAGFFATRLLITPHGRDFEYQATGGTLKMAPVPELQLRRTHLLITKKLLSLYQLELIPKEKTDGFIRAEGTAGTGQDRSVDFKFSFDRVPISDWLPADWKNHFTGLASGNAHWTGKNPKQESSIAQASLHLLDVRINQLPLLQELAAISKKPSLDHLELTDCSAEMEWTYPKAEVKNISIEDKGVFRIEGSVLVNHQSLGGSIELGVAREYLDWLAEAEELFPKRRDGYLWTTVHLSGTIQRPSQDLSPRVIDALKESPTALLGALLRQLSEWSKNLFD